MPTLLDQKGHKGPPCPLWLIVFAWILVPRPVFAAPITIDAQARPLHPGELVVLTIALPAPVNRLDVTVFGRPAAAFKVDDLTWRALIGIDLAVKAGSYVVSIDAHHDGLRATERLQVLPHRFPSRAL